MHNTLWVLLEGGVEFEGVLISKKGCWDRKGDIESWRQPCCNRVTKGVKYICSFPVSNTRIGIPRSILVSVGDGKVLCLKSVERL
jgi:hypothetical protein